MFLPGSHRLTEPPAIPPGQINPPSAISPDPGPTDVVLFKNRTWHAGDLNTSGAPRLAFMLQYGYRWLGPVDDSATALHTRDDLTPIQRQLLGAPDRNADGSLAKGRGAEPLRQWQGNRPGQAQPHPRDQPPARLAQRAVSNNR